MVHTMLLHKTPYGAENTMYYLLFAIELNSFLKFYVMGSPEIDLFGIAHVKVEFIPVLKIYTIPILGRFVWDRVK